MTGQGADRGGEPGSRRRRLLGLAVVGALVAVWEGSQALFAIPTYKLPHIHEILAIPGFQEAELLREVDDGERVVWTIRYHLDSRDALEAYLRDHAPRLRADGQARFGNRFTATRRVLELVRNFGG